MFWCLLIVNILVIDPDSPGYVTFDHIVPNEARLVVCARMIKEMKKDLTGD